MNKVIVVGGGIIGLLSACELHKNGFEVTIIERQNFGQESTWAGGGIVSPLFPWRYPDEITDLSRISQQLYPEIIQHMQQATGLDAEFLPSGMLVAGDYSDENPGAWAERTQTPMQLVDQTQLQEIAPELSDQHQMGYWFPQVHQVRNPRLVALALAYTKLCGIQLIEHQPVTEILTRAGQATGVRTEQGDYHADAVVIAGGAWTTHILNGHSTARTIKPIKGQMLLLKGEPGAVGHIILSEDRYIIPRKDGRILVGSTTEDAGFNKGTDDKIRQSLLAYAINTVPALQQYELEAQWAGLRPSSNDGIPVIGPHPTIKNLFINSGHYRNGVAMGPASVQLLTEIMMGQPTTLLTQKYAPGYSAQGLEISQ